MGLVCCKGSYAQRGVEREGGKEGGEKGMGKGMGSGAGRGKFKGKPTGRRHFSTPEEMGMLFHHWFFFFGVGSSFLASSSEVEEGLLCTGRQGDNWVVAICTCRISGSSGS